MDNLLSCEAILSGLREASAESENFRGAFFFDSEEIGSETRDGAAGNFADAMLLRIADSLSFNRGEFLGILSDSLLLSLDVAHATHPAFSEKMETNHSPILGNGVVLKINVADLDVHQRVCADSCRQKGVDCRPAAPFDKAVAGGALQELIKLGVGVGVLEGFVHLHHGDVDELHVLPLGAEPKEDAKPTGPTIHGGHLVALVHLVEDEILVELVGDLIQVGDFGDLLEIAKVFRVILNGSR